ncbi:hypothetical protein RI046_04400 [Herbaspirillum huttiense subsp. nephrolepidis]|uniref:Uncharacterized protein n=1 Tax=Herbaspirillum huttiense TaxID=863372 RepID=A0AAJ2LS98_9BURK|nr:hypothetical protein [Herbaspirillum huttiense]MDR9834920.1 hypothetical protein [Herbaspirillum huttiense]
MRTVQVGQCPRGPLDLRFDLAQAHGDVAEVRRVDPVQLQDTEEVLLPALGLAPAGGEVGALLGAIFPPGLGRRLDVSNDRNDPVLCQDLIQDRLRHEFVHFRCADPLGVLAEASLGLAASVVVVSAAAAGTAFDMHGAATQVATENSGQKMMASRRAAGHERRPVLDAALHILEKHLVDDGLVALRAHPCLLWLHHAAFAPSEDGVPGVDLILQHEIDAGAVPAAATLKPADAIELVGDGCRAHALQAHLEHVADHAGLTGIDHQLLARAQRDRLVAERDAAAVVEAFLRVLDHAALGVLRDPAADIFVHHLQESFHEPALIGRRVEIHGDVDDIGAQGAQVPLVHRRINAVASEARRVPGNEEIRLVLLAIGDGRLEVLAPVRAAGDTAVGEGGDYRCIEVLGLLAGELELALDGQLLLGLLDRADAQINDGCFHARILCFLARRPILEIVIFSLRSLLTIA